jgi:hypothetical protein
MKLPEYDNRPPAGTPLYSDPDSGTREAKGLMLAIVGIIALLCFFIFGIGGSIKLLVDVLRSIFH